jgi:hypothetical protein
VLRIEVLASRCLSEAEVYRLAVERILAVDRQAADKFEDDSTLAAYKSGRDNRLAADKLAPVGKLEPVGRQGLDKLVDIEPIQS